ncbi:hypothetical protein [Phytohabitans houttuyneae]|uniref:hypothetical protein n=1 Tax=Phytohabitans houttuyneae TaxID=1076126 RepID=UPI0015657223|nr:hypothetical protein [Phytohabitans houttuyneae]
MAGQHACPGAAATDDVPANQVIPPRPDVTSAACPDLAGPCTVTVPLSRPLGDRELYDAAGRRWSRPTAERTESGAPPGQEGRRG